ncbi:class I SAM-dependent methyltransferase [Sodalis ligni]|uniref:class I SAM-dependent methyltransferase n=1 Tax=Sodalis ligni TaxID=2697027 RepID=UPI00104EDA29|nr:class I SAM-dependent methyltransferase [Sodalis ligni]
MRLNNINPILSSNHFIFDETIGVWRQEILSEFAYNDGDEAEDYVFEALKSSADVSIVSTELVTKIKDWPSLYHLSSLRSNLLRPFEPWLKGKRVLEIGCGCGAITRFLGESGAQVVSVEGSLRRASIARERCRDLHNVDIICAPSDQVPDLGQFDAVMLIGVLEYARMFLGANGQQVLLTACKQRMTPEGRLFVAIENKLGIKYFAGANEDHVNIPMYGINNSYHEKGVITFGRQELSKVLAKAGFGFTENYLPLPDYKLPVSLVTPEGWKHHGADMAQLALESAHKDQQIIAENTFSLEQGLYNVWNNGLGADLANSFLVIASQQALSSLTPNIAAFHYSDSRQQEYRKATTFVISADGQLSVQAERNSEENNQSENSLHHVPDRDSFHHGVTLWLELVYIINRPDWRMSEVGDWARSWINQLLIRENLPIAYECGTIIPNSYQDALPFNIIRQDNGELIFFDQEWQSQESISIAYIAFRGILHSFLRLSSVSFTQFYNETNLAIIALDVLKEVGFILDKNDLVDFISQEAHFLALIQQKDEEQLSQTLNNLKMVVRAPSIGFLRLETKTFGVLEKTQLQQIKDYEAQLDLLQRQTTKRVTTLEQETATLVDNLQRQIVEQATIIASQNRAINEIINSSSWRISAPVRIVGRNIPLFFRRLCRGALYRLFVGGRTLKVELGNVEHSKNTQNMKLSVATFKLKARSLAKSIYSRAPERYKGRLLRFAMRVRPAWFLHHPSYRPEIGPRDMGLAQLADRLQFGPTYISHNADGSYHYAPDRMNISISPPKNLVIMKKL